MMKTFPVIVVLLSAVLSGPSVSAGGSSLFGTESDIRFANTLWQQLGRDGLVGDKAVMSTPYTGTHPHGAILDTIESRTTVNGHTGDVIVKRNYGGEGVTKTAVADNPGKWLKAVTVMFRRERGYDADNHDWFWVKFSPTGEIMKNPAKISLAGRVGKGTGKGCIACHTGAPGDDRVFNHDKYK